MVRAIDSSNVYQSALQSEAPSNQQRTDTKNHRSHWGASSISESEYDLGLDVAMKAPNQYGPQLANSRSCTCDNTCSGCTQTDSGCRGTDSNCYSTQSRCGHTDSV